MMVDSAGREILRQCQDLNKLGKVPQQGGKAGRVQWHEPERHRVFTKKVKEFDSIRDWRSEWGWWTMTTQPLSPHHGPEDCGYETGLQWRGPSGESQVSAQARRRRW